MNLFNILLGGARPDLLALSNGTISDSTGPIAVSTIRFNADGSTEKSIHSVYSEYNAGEWYIPEPVSGVGGSYEVSLISFTGFTPSGPATGVWNSMSSAVEWSYTSGASGSRNSNLTIGLRRAGSSVTEVTATITLNTNLP